MRRILSRYQSLKLNKSKNYFLITSHGQTASMWLAGILNKIPGIYCTHGYTYPPVQATLDEISSDDIQHRYASMQRFETLSLRNYFHELTSVTDAPIVGNVLSFYLGRLLARSSRWQLRERNLKIVNLIRHPVTRLNSTLKTWDPNGLGEMPPFVSIDFNNHCSHIIKFIKSKYHVDLATSKVKLFVVALLAMEHIARDVDLAKQNGILSVKFEEMTSDINVFTALMLYIIGNDSPENKTIFKEIFSIEKMNAHNKGVKNDPKAQYLEWEPWQQGAFDFVAERCQLNKVYSDHGYHFNF